MAIGRISGPMLQQDLDRQGIDLQFSTNGQSLVHLDFTNFRLGVNTVAITETVTVNGNLSVGVVKVDTDTISTTALNTNLIIAPTGNLFLSPASERRLASAKSFL